MSDLDPYQTPASSLDDAIPESSSAINAEGWPLASRWQRLGASLIDTLIMLSAVIIAFIPLFFYDEDLLLDGLAELLGTVVASVAYLLINGHWMAKHGQTVGRPWARRRSAFTWWL